jgi:lysophospholipase L1-like esterase
MLRQIAAIRDRGDTIDVVTVQIGANDLFAAAGTPGFLGLDPAVQNALVMAKVRQLQTNYAALLTELRQQLPDAELYLLGYHNPYPGRPDHPLAPLSVPAVRGVNAVAAGLAPMFGGTFVSFYDAILGNELKYTLIAADDETNNVHLNDAGYGVAGEVLIRAAAGTPEPGTLALAALGFLGAAGYRGVRRGRAAAAA